MHAFVPSVAILALLSACISAPSNRLDPISFHCTRTCFDGGDEIEVESVSAKDGTFRPGSEIEVRGRYHLQTRQRARLCLGLTGGDVGGDSWHEVERGAGKFDLTARVIQPGAPHVALYSYDTAYNCLGNCAIVVDHSTR